MILGIDVGVSGAVAVLTDNGGYREVFDLPIMDGSVGKKARSVINARGLRDILAAWLQCEQGGAKAYVERIHAMPKNGVIAAFSQGHSLGTVLAVLAFLDIPYVLVPPQTWKKPFALPGGDEGKEKARAKAIQLYPAAPLARKKDKDRAEALLIATYGRGQSFS